MTTTDDGGTPDEAAADVASDTGAGDVAGSDGGGTDGADGGDDPCYPPCRSRLYGGQIPEMLQPLPTGKWIS